MERLLTFSMTRGIGIRLVPAADERIINVYYTAGLSIASLVSPLYKNRVRFSAGPGE